MYRIIQQNVPQNLRAEINEKILFSIRSGKKLIPAESIYNCYTGIGGLHNLNQTDFQNFHEFSEAKKEVEMGQFFTPHSICKDMVDVLSPSPSEMILDMCCGMGNFFNFLPNQHNVYGFDIDGNAVAVAKYLYPDAHIEHVDIQLFSPQQRFDVIIGNPPFNLKFGNVLSQEYYLQKAYNVLNPAGFLMVIVPTSFLQSSFWDKSRISRIEADFSFVGQVALKDDVFSAVGVKKFSTKIMVFLRKSVHIDMQPYQADEFVSVDELKMRIQKVRAMKHGLRFDLMRETNRLDKDELERFEYKLKKYLFELKTHAHLQKHVEKAESLVSRFRNQKPPENASCEQIKAWEKSKLTTGKVLAVIRKYIKLQNQVQRKEVAIVKTSYTVKLKAYAPRLLDKIPYRLASLNNLVLDRADIPMPETMSMENYAQLKAIKKLIARKQKDFKIQNMAFADMAADEQIQEYLRKAVFVNKEGVTCHFTQLQQHDLNLAMQKRFVLLNWQQGSGKTAAVFHWTKRLMDNNSVRNVIILAPAIAANMTWAPFLKYNGVPYKVIRKQCDLDRVPDGVFLLVSTSLLTKLQRALTRFVKIKSRKIGLAFDESDEITNPTSQRTRNILGLFRRLPYKILATGTTTRNNIAELYSQFELLYNNSVNLMCESSMVYFQGKEGDICSKPNDNYMLPFPAYHGHVLFRSCHCPGKATVFGIEKQNQDVYNKTELFDIIAKTVVTRKFKDFAGDKYRIHTHNVNPADGERQVYHTIISEFYRICDLYYNSTGDSRKDAGLRLMRQIKLLIKACSIPHTIEGYYGDLLPGKVQYIQNLIRDIPEKVAVGCTSLAAQQLYAECLKKAFPDRPVFAVTGEVSFNKRQDIVNDFNTSANGILVCTQQSLSSSVNIPDCNQVILESLQWNIPRMEQFYFRFIRLDSKALKDVHYVTYADSIEQNLMALVLTKERLNEFIKTGEIKDESDIFEEFDINMSVIDSLLTRTTDEEGHIKISWGSQRLAG